MPAKYRVYYQKMLADHAELFNQFSLIHQQYQDSAVEHAEAFNQIGRQVLEVIRDYERRLCGGMERGQFAGFSGGLASKFWEEIRRHYPLIDRVGIKVSPAKV